MSASQNREKCDRCGKKRRTAPSAEPAKGHYICPACEKEMAAGEGPHKVYTTLPKRIKRPIIFRPSKPGQLVDGAVDEPYEVVESDECKGVFHVEMIDRENEGLCYVAIFSGPSAEDRAWEYAAWKNAHFEGSKDGLNPEPPWPPPTP
jgi:hypothetical protein